MCDAFKTVIKHMKEFKGFDGGDLVFETSNLTEEDFEAIKHIRFNSMTGQVFDDRKEKCKMARLYKINMFVLDVNGEYEDIHELIEYAFDRTEASAHFIEAQTVEFPWHDNIILNRSSSTKQDYEDFMDETKRRNKIVKNVINLRYDALKESVKKILESTGIDPTDENIVEFMEQMKYETEWKIGE